MHSIRKRVAVSRVVAVVFVVVIIVLAGVGFLLISPRTTTPSSSSSTASSMNGFGPSNSSVLVDDCAGFLGTPDALDPATAVVEPDNWVFNNVFQELTSFVGPNSTVGVVTPALAQSYTIQNNQILTFNIRPGVAFSNGNPVNAAVVWFSFVRNLYMNQGIVALNYIYLTVNTTTPTITGLTLPWGLLDAVQSATGLPTTTNYKLAETVLNNMLSNFDPNNATIQKIMSYPDQAYVVTGPMTFTINLIKPYSPPYFLSNIAQWWAAILDPVYIDAHGGVQANTPNSYFNLNGGPGTGPYYIASIGTGFSTFVLKANPTYWGLHATNIPPVLQPAHIPVIVINYGLSTSQKSEAFATNQAQISWVDFPLLGQAWDAYGYKQYATFSQVFDNFGAGPNTSYFSLNPGKYPTSNNDFRLAVVHAINYTQMLDESYTFNGTVYAQNYLGPLSQPWGKYYNPDNLPLYSYDIPLAINYMNQAGQQEHFSLTLPNGTVIGDTSAPTLAPVQLVLVAPITTTEQTQATIVQSDLSQIGLPIAVQAVTASEELTYSNAQTTPNMFYGGWGPDFPDPILQQMYELLTPSIPVVSLMNDTQATQILNSLTFETNQTTYIHGIAQLYNITYNYAPFIWLPNYDNYVLLQPYVHGMVYSPYTTPFGMYWYNTLYYGSS
ncbi:MAG: ABC transporter substrate-binding protein [Candidatus Bathyarchaeia archaeon]|jgi:ABC-type transport system substrate-binding protein